MNEEQAKKLQNWINQKSLRLTCEVCGGTNWATGDIIMAPSFNDTALKLGGTGVPMAQVACKNCGNIKLFAATVVGLLK